MGSQRLRRNERCSLKVTVLRTGECVGWPLILVIASAIFKLMPNGWDSELSDRRRTASLVKPETLGICSFADSRDNDDHRRFGAREGVEGSRVR